MTRKYCKNLADIDSDDSDLTESALTHPPVKPAPILI
jgi:hypothetical protein